MCVFVCFCLWLTGARARAHPRVLLVQVLSVEASAKWGWERYSHASIGLTEFGRSAPIADVYEFFGITPEKVADKALKMMDYYSVKPVPTLYRPSFD